MTMHNELQSLRDGYLKTAKQMRELNKQGYATHREIMAQVCEDLAQRLDGILERYGWQDISTAPKDGTPILAYDSLTEYQVVFWGDIKVLETNEDGTYPQGWTDGYMPVVWDGEVPDGGWMPLPSPPEAAEQKAGRESE